MKTDLDQVLQSGMFQMGSQIRRNFHFLATVPLVKLFQLTILPRRPVKLLVQIAAVEMATGFCIEVLTVQIHCGRKATFPRCNTYRLRGIVICLCNGLAVLLDADDDTGFLVPVQILRRAFVPSGIYLQDTNNDLVTAQLLNYRRRFPIPEPSALSVGLHFEWTVA